MASVSGSLPTNRSKPAVLLLGNYRPTLAVARGLAAEGYRVILGREGDEGGCELSRFVSEVWDNPELGRGEDTFLVSLEEFLTSRRDIGVVFPIAEEFVNLFAASDWQPPRGVVLASPNHRAVRAFSQKINALRMADRLGIPTLPFETVENRMELLDAAHSIGFPLTIRPLGTTARLGPVKALIADSAEQLVSILPAWPVGHNRLLLQRFAHGSRHNVFFAASGGQLLAVAESRIRRTNHSSGTGLAVSGITLLLTPGLIRDTKLLVADCSYTGIGLAQFILNSETGERCFIELNPRVSGSHVVPERSGIPLSAMAVSLALGESVTVPEPYLQGREGMRYVWTTGEIKGLKSQMRTGSTRVAPAFVAAVASLGDALAADTDMVWSWDDPLPGLRAFWHAIPWTNRRGRPVVKRQPSTPGNSDHRI